jgi:hypothetical protein
MLKNVELGKLLLRWCKKMEKAYKHNRISCKCCFRMHVNQNGLCYVHQAALIAEVKRKQLEECGLLYNRPRTGKIKGRISR